jgi:hypothetical protein
MVAIFSTQAAIFLKPLPGIGIKNLGPDISVVAS